MNIYIENFGETQISKIENFEFLSEFDAAKCDIIISSHPEKYLDFMSKPNKYFILFCEENSINTLIETRDLPIFHIIGKSEGQNYELKLILQKIYFKNYFGIEKYLREDAQIFSEEITHSKDINEKIEIIIDKLNYDDTFDSPKDNLRIVLNELATNAFFHQEDLIDTNRANSIFTSSNNSIILKAAKDSSSIIVYVKDNIGTIKRDQLINSIKRGYEEKTPRVGESGAGLGLYMVYENINQLHINKKNDHFCEFIGIIEVNKRYKKFKERVTSFHFFEE